MCEIPASAPHWIDENSKHHQVATSPVQPGCRVVSFMNWQEANASATWACSQQQMINSQEAVGTNGLVRPMTSLVTVRTACNAGGGSIVGRVPVPTSPVLMSHVAATQHNVSDGPSPIMSGLFPIRSGLSPIRSERICSGLLPSGHCFGSCAVTGNVGGLQATCCGSQVGIGSITPTASSCNPAGAVVRWVTDGAATDRRGVGGNTVSSASSSLLHRRHWGRKGGSVHVCIRTDPCISPGKVMCNTPRTCGNSSVESAICDDKVEVWSVADSDTFSRHDSDGVNSECGDAPVTHEVTVVTSPADAVGSNVLRCHGPPTPKGETAACGGAKAIRAPPCGALARVPGGNGGHVRQRGATSNNSTSKGHKSMRRRSSGCTVEAAHAIKGGNAGGESPSPRDALPGKRQVSPPGYGPHRFSSGGSAVITAANTSGNTAGNNQSRGSRFRSSVGGGGGTSAASARRPTPQSHGGQLALSGNNPRIVARAQSARLIPDSPTVPEIQSTSNNPSSRIRSAAKFEQSTRSRSVPRQRPAASADVSQQGVGPSSSQNKQALHGRAPPAQVTSPPPTRQPHHSPGAALQTTLAAAARQSIRPAEPSNKCKITLFNFLRGTGVDAHGRRFEDIMEWDFRRMERSHDYIQWLFPTDEPSRFNSRAPVLTPDLVTIFRKDPAIVASIRRAL
eukprot:CAMPEP_0172656924 /NCGR_PEP_ID=MMETSP1074-20121228/1729_1 /TAXON_ID=2916 /ORGANISM="Ceratium fusus, Strain PA161109" /LENGTH=677 /DNA_ID=CAMNT_0013471899 /DNA_START=53 /DNA_END=2082 /DNA_ORIENTATION=-